MTWNGPSGWDPVSMTACLTPEDVDNLNAEINARKVARDAALIARDDAWSALQVAQQDYNTKEGTRMNTQMAYDSILTEQSMYTECP